MKKIYWILIIIAVLFLLSAGCSDTKKSKQVTTTYPNYGNGYQQSYPSTSSNGYNTWEAINERQKEQMKRDEIEKEYMAKYWEIENRKIENHKMDI